MDDLEYVEQLIAGHRWEHVIRPPLSQYVHTTDIRRDSNMTHIIREIPAAPVANTGIERNLIPFIVGSGAFIWSPHDSTRNLTHVKFIRSGSKFNIYHTFLAYGKQTEPTNVPVWWLDYSRPPAGQYVDPTLYSFREANFGPQATWDTSHWTLTFNSAFPVPLADDTVTMFDPIHDVLPDSKTGNTIPENLKPTFIGSMRTNSGIMSVSAVTSGQSTVSVGESSLSGYFTAGLVTDLRTIIQPSTFTKLSNETSLPCSSSYMNQVIANRKHIVSESPLKDGGVICVMGPDLRDSLHEADYSSENKENLFTETFTLTSMDSDRQLPDALNMSYKVQTEYSQFPIAMEARFITPYDCTLTQTNFPGNITHAQPCKPLIYRNGMFPKSRLNIRVRGSFLGIFNTVVLSEDSYLNIGISWVHMYIQSYLRNDRQNGLGENEPCYAEIVTEIGSQHLTAAYAVGNLTTESNTNGYIASFDYEIPTPPLKREAFYVGSYVQLDYSRNYHFGEYDTNSPAPRNHLIKLVYNVSAPEANRTCAPARVVQYDGVSLGTQITCNIVEHFEVTLKDRPAMTQRMGTRNFSENERLTSWDTIHRLQDMFEYEQCPLKYIWKAKEYTNFIRGLPTLNQIPSAWRPNRTFKKRRRIQIETDDASLLNTASSALTAIGSSVTHNVASFHHYRMSM